MGVVGVSGLFRRAATWTVVITVVITLNILLHFSDLVPSKHSHDKVWYTDKFTFNIPGDLPNAELWDPSYIDLGTDHYSVLETHAHTTVSDGSLSPRQLVDWAIAYGFTVLFVTDHNDVDGGLEAQKYAQQERPNEVLVIPGVEYTCCRIHMNLIGINETISPTSPWPTDDELRAVVTRTHDLGGIVLVNHIPWSMTTEFGHQLSRLPTHPTRETLLNMGVDGFESVSEGVLDLATIRFNEEHNLPLFGASDIHDPDTTPVAWTVIKHNGPPTQQLILDAFRQNSMSFYYDPTDPLPRVYGDHNTLWSKFAPLLALDMTYFWTETKGMYSFVDGFCHTNKFVFHYSRAFWTLFYILSAFTITHIYKAKTSASAQNKKLYLD
jgi:predicted metal-dependent phosphoesterase TrpH